MPAGDDIVSSRSPKASRLPAKSDYQDNLLFQSEALIYSSKFYAVRDKSIKW